MIPLDTNERVFWRPFITGGFRSAPFPIAIKCHNHTQATNVLSTLQPLMKKISQDTSPTDAARIFYKSPGTASLFNGTVTKFYVVVVGHESGIYLRWWVLVLVHQSSYLTPSSAGTNVKKPLMDFLVLVSRRWRVSPVHYSFLSQRPTVLVMPPISPVRVLLPWIWLVSLLPMVCAITFIPYILLLNKCLGSASRMKSPMSGAISKFLFVVYI